MVNTRTCKVGLLVTFSLAIAMALAMSVCTVRAWAVTWTTDDFSYYETTVTGLTEAGKAKLKADQNLVIPDQGPDGADVTAIGNGERDKGTFLAETSDGYVIPTSVKLPAKLESIGSYAFAGVPVDQTAGVYAGLSSVDFPATVTSIGNCAFQRAPLEGELVLPEGLEFMGTCAFNNHEKAPKKITKVSIPASLDEIPQDAFYHQAIEDISIPEGVEHIGGSAFRSNHAKTISLPSTLTSISGNAFSDNLLSEVEIPAKVRSIGVNAFGNHSGVEKTLAKLTLHEGLNIIERDAFCGSTLTSVDLPTTVTGLHEGAFDNGKHTVMLLSAKYDQMKGEGDYAEVAAAGSGHRVVGDLARATIAAIPDQELLAGPVEPELDVTFDGHKLEAGTDYEATYVNNDKVGDATAWARGVEGGPFAGEKSAGFKVVAPSWKATDFTYADDGAEVTGLTGYGKQKLRALPDLVLPDRSPGGAYVTAIGPADDFDKGTFFADAPGGTAVPTSVVLPAKLESIGSHAFAGFAVDKSAGEFAGISSVDFPATVTSIDTGAFRNAPLEGELALPEGLTSLGSCAFYTDNRASKKITGVVIPAGLEEIPAGAFLSQAIEDVSIPEGVKVVGDSAFGGNSSKTLSLPSTLTRIGGSAFGNHQFSEVEIPGSVEAVGSSAFHYSGTDEEKTLEKLTLNEGLASIGEGAFAGSALESVALPTTVTELHEDAFSNGKHTVMLLSAKYDQVKGEGDYAEVAAAGSGHRVVGDLAWATIAAIPDQELLAGLVEPELDVTFDGHKLEAGTDYEATYVNNDKVGDATATAKGIGEGGFFNETSAPFKVVAPSWKATDFTYDQAGTTVTGLTEAGKAKLKADQNLVIPDKGPDGADVTAIGNGERDKGTFLAETSDGYVIPTSVKLPAKLESIGPYAFAGAPVDQAAGVYAGLSSVDIPASVTYIGNFAFLNAPLEGELALPEGLTSMGDGAFETVWNAPKKITKASIPAGLKQIPGAAFYHQAIEDVSIPEGVEYIGSSAFSYNSSKTVSLPSTLVSISNGAFAGNRFAEVVIPRSVRSIYSSAFENEKTLAKLTLNEGLINIESVAFGGSALESVDLPTTVTELHADAFKGGSKGTVRLVGTKYDQIKGEGDYAEVAAAGSGHRVVGDLARATIAAIPDQELLAGPVEPELDVTFDGHKLEAGTDYEATYVNNDKVGDATATAKGIGEGGFFNETSAPFKVVAPSLKARKYAPLVPKMTTKGKRALTVAWADVKGADGYDVFFACCNHKGKQNKLKKVATLKGAGTILWSEKGLKPYMAYKACVKAFKMQNGKKVYIKSSPTMHTYTAGGNKKYTNANGVEIKKMKVTLKKGKTFKIKAKVIKLDKSKKLMPKTHAPALRYRSSDKSVATVSEKGKIKAKGKGTCYVYVVAHNGLSKKVKVTVK